jgi:XrtJ-associated TM-motif-TM protein
MRTIRYGWLAVGFVLVTSALHAQSGCADSPEAPTIVLMLVGAVGLSGGRLAPREILKRLRRR